MKPNEFEPDKYMTIQEAADYLGKSREWVSLRAKRGIIKSVRYGRRGLQVERDSVEKAKRLT